MKKEHSEIARKEILSGIKFPYNKLDMLVKSCKSESEICPTYFCKTHLE